MPIDHVGFNVSDFAASKAFFLRALAPLGIGVVADGPEWALLGTNGKAEFWFGATGPAPQRVHLAFAAATRAQERSFHAAALSAGGQDHGAPGLRPQYHLDYYGAFVIGPDGHNVEAVCHAAEPA